MKKTQVAILFIVPVVLVAFILFVPFIYSPTCGSIQAGSVLVANSDPHYGSIAFTYLGQGANYAPKVFSNDKWQDWGYFWQFSCPPPSAPNTSVTITTAGST